MASMRSENAAPCAVRCGPLLCVIAPLVRSMTSGSGTEPSECDERVQPAPSTSTTKRSGYVWSTNITREDTHGELDTGRNTTHHQHLHTRTRQVAGIRVQSVWR